MSQVAAVDLCGSSGAFGCSMTFVELAIVIPTLPSRCDVRLYLFLLDHPTLALL